MGRKPIIVGNWKMELSHKAAREIAHAVKTLLHNIHVAADVVICPSFPSLGVVQEELQRSENLFVGAQNIHHEEKGAWTGEVSVVQIHSVATWCIVGHSEVRSVTHESETLVVKKVGLLLKHGIKPIICIGETQEEKHDDLTIKKVTGQMDVILQGIERTSLPHLVIAYEPIWAIGSGVLPDPDTVCETILLIRKLVAERHGQDSADRLRIIYGGSVTKDNVGRYVGGPCADGVLLGGASLHPREFVDIVSIVQENVR